MAEAEPAAAGSDDASDRASDRARIAFLLDDLEGGGVQRTTLVLAGEFARHGHEVELLVFRKAGELLPLVPPGVGAYELTRAPRLAACRSALRGDRALARRIAEDLLLRRGRLLRHGAQLPALVRHLRAHRPTVLVGATPRVNVLAVAAARASGVGTRTIVTERISVSAKRSAPGARRWRTLLPLMRRAYALADHVVAVSQDLAADVATTLRLPHERVLAISNPVVGADLRAWIDEPLADPWFAPGAPPVLLSAGRISAQKDFETLVRAFARVRRTRPCRLLILGKNHGARGRDERRTRLLALAAELGVGADVRLPGFVPNPFPYMARAALFVLSSRYEGLPGVLIQALGCGTPVVSTDCPTGPREILEDGRYGPLVPVGDPAALAKAIVDTLERPPPRPWLAARAAHFSVERAYRAYRSLVLGARAP